jgi:hypothetical protein
VLALREEELHEKLPGATGIPGNGAASHGVIIRET